jgi:hypothetical protein
LQVQQLEFSFRQGCASDEDGIPDLVEEDCDDMVNIPIISFFQADGLILVDPDEVKTQVFYDDTIRTLKRTG